MAPAIDMSIDSRCEGRHLKELIFDNFDYLGQIRAGLAFEFGYRSSE